MIMDVNDELDFVATEHNRLVSAVSKLDKTQHIKEPTRNEPTNLNTEFNLVKHAKKLNISNLTKVFEETANHVQISQKLKKSKDISKILHKPLEKPQAERIRRATGYEETKKKIGRWDPVVARSRTVDFVSFPLKTASTKLYPTQDFLSKLTLKSPLEKELANIDPPVANESTDEEEHVYPMTYQEMLEHRQHIAKFRAQQSYKAAKAKRQSKIKSKKYHRILKKEKLKQQLKEFEELQKTNPEEALKKLEALEKTRALERHTLRHKNTGKWAKSKLIRAKYDKEVRQQLSEQLAVSRGLTKKIKDSDSSDNEMNESEGIPDSTILHDPLNPWMMKSSEKSNTDEFNFGYKKYLQEKRLEQQIESASDSEHEKPISDPAENCEVNTTNLAIPKNTLDIFSHGQKRKLSDFTKCKTPSKNKRQLKPINEGSTTKTNIVSTSKWIVESVNKDSKEKLTNDISSVFESFEKDVTEKVEKKLSKLRKSIKILDGNQFPIISKKEKRAPIDNLEYLKLKKQKTKPIIDEELIETGRKTVENDNKINISKILTQVTNEQSESNIDPSRFIEVKPKYLNTTLPSSENNLDQLDDNDDDEQVVPKVNIEEVFEEDDVVASFRQEKEDEINEDKPKDIDVSLPGWGSWGGKGIKAPKRKRNRFILKAPPKEVRRDENKGDIIIKEYKDPKLSKHKVTDVPFPFTSVKEYEASIRLPLGNTFIPENAHKKLIRPNVITKAGSIIDPMDEEELLVRKNRNFKNDAVIKLLGQK